MSSSVLKNIAILGGGPSGLFIFKRLVDRKETGLQIHIFEQGSLLGSGMPYSKLGANHEHITNVSGNEIPALETTVEEWIRTLPNETLEEFRIDPEKFNEYKVMPRLLFGQYLKAQFELLLERAAQEGIFTQVHFNSKITDISDLPEQRKTAIEVNGKDQHLFDRVIISTGHRWPLQYEGKIKGYFDSPYPPSKLCFKANHAVAIKGTSLTAIDALRTLARANGDFATAENGWVSYKAYAECPQFKLIMHSRHGLLPAIRFHLEDSHLKDTVLHEEDIAGNRAENNGFLSLDFVFEHNFKAIFMEKDPEFYALIRDMNMENFVTAMMHYREGKDPFELLKMEYREAEQSIKQEKSVYWKEMLGALSFAMNYPAKYFSAEDTLRLQKYLMPLISVVIAYVPQSSVKEMFALHQAGILSVMAVGEDSSILPQETGGILYEYHDESGVPQSVHFQTFVDCVGQPHLSFEDLPYTSLIRKQSVTPARLYFNDQDAGKAALEDGNSDVDQDSSGAYRLQVPGIEINDYFQVIDPNGHANERIYMMAVAYIGGYNPDYSGLDFCEAASEKIVNHLFSDLKNAL